MSQRNSPISAFPVSSRERRALCAQFRQAICSGDQEIINKFQSIVDQLLPLPFLTNLDQFTNVVTPPHSLEKLESILSGGYNLEEWAKQLRPYNVSPVCGLVWSASYIGYRCKTCSRNPNMSLCADCFRSGNHEGHDSNMFKSSSGGTCDCGNASVMSPSGFCQYHGKNTVSKAPKELVATAPYIFFRYLWRLAVYFRSAYNAVFQLRLNSKSNRSHSEVSEEMYLPFSLGFNDSDLSRVKHLNISNIKIYLFFFFDD